MFRVVSTVYHNSVTIINPFLVPGISLRLAFNTVEHCNQFFLFNKRHKDLVNLFSKNNTGGPAIIFSRYMEAGWCIYSR